jgi:hypothetical protein
MSAKNYTVVFRPPIEQRLTDLWLRLRQERQRNTNAADQIEMMLQKDPVVNSVVCFDTVRILSVDPLGVEFEVFEDDRKVIVLARWHIQEAGP